MLLPFCNGCEGTAQFWFILFPPHNSTVATSYKHNWKNLEQMGLDFQTKRKPHVLYYSVNSVLTASRTTCPGICLCSLSASHTGFHGQFLHVMSGSTSPSLQQLRSKYYGKGETEKRWKEGSNFHCLQGLLKIEMAAQIGHHSSTHLLLSNEWHLSSPAPVYPI